MAQLLIHIGTPKTGSTAIQSVLRTNAERLDKAGVNYIRAGRRSQAHNLVLQARRAGTMGRVMDRILAEIATKPEHMHVLTSELYFRSGAAQDIADHLPEKLRARTRILVYLRRQDRFIEALYKQRLKTGRTAAGAAEFAQNKIGNGSYGRMLAAFANAFGAQALIVRPFERQHFPQGNVAFDAVGHMGIDDPSVLTLPSQDVNLTLSLEVSQLLGRLARTTDVNVQEVIRHISRDPPEGAARSGDCFSIDDRRAIMAQFAEGNEALRQTYCPDLLHLFDLSDLAQDIPDATPDPAERLARLEQAQQIVFGALEQMR